MRKLTGLPGVLTLVVGLASASSASHGEDMRVSFWVAPTHAVVRAFESWGTSLSEMTGGKLTAAFFTAGQLGAAADHYEMARDGVVEMAMIALTDYPDRFPILQLAEVPFTVSDSVKGVEVLHEWYKPFAEIEMPDVKLCVMTMYYPATFHTTGKPVHVPQDLNLMKIRTYNGTTARFVAHEGAAAVQVSVPVLREILANGVVDGIGFPWDVGVAEVGDLLPFHVDLPIYVGIQAYVMNRAFYDGLANDKKDAVDAHCTPEWSARLSTEWAEHSKAARAAIAADPEQEVYAPTQEETALWMASADEIAKDSLAATKRFDVEGAAAFADLKARLKAAGAGF